MSGQLLFACVEVEWSGVGWSGIEWRTGAAPDCSSTRHRSTRTPWPSITVPSSSSTSDTTLGPISHCSTIDKHL